MQLINRAMAGTLESSDAQISIAPGNDGIVLHIQSLSLIHISEPTRRS